MIYIINIQLLLGQISLLLEYFVSGFIFITIFYKLTSRNINNNYHIIWSVVISFIIKECFVILHQYIFINKTFILGERVIICSVFALILSIFCVFISERKWFNNIWISINNKSIHDNVWQDIIDFNRGTSLRIICDKENIIYGGILDCYEEKGLDSWFVLKDYVIEYKDGKTVDSRNILQESRISVNLKTVDRIELYYGGSKTNIIK